MPTMTPAAFALELARARRAAIVEASNLMHALEEAGQSVAVMAAALGGLEREAEAETDRLEAALAAKPAPKKRARRRAAPAPAPETIPEPEPERAPVSDAV